MSCEDREETDFCSSDSMGEIYSRLSVETLCGFADPGVAVSDVSKTSGNDSLATLFCDFIVLSDWSPLIPDPFLSSVAADGVFARWSLAKGLSLPFFFFLSDSLSTFASWLKNDPAKFLMDLWIPLPGIFLFFLSGFFAVRRRILF